MSWPTLVQYDVQLAAFGFLLNKDNSRQCLILNRTEFFRLHFLISITIANFNANWGFGNHSSYSTCCLAGAAMLALAFVVLNRLLPFDAHTIFNRQTLRWIKRQPISRL
jgi:hypothetical protein